MSITVTLTNPRHLAAANAAYQMTIPADPETPAPYPNVDAYVQASLEQVCNSWADTTGVDAIPVGAFVRRFSGSEFDAITASEDPNVADIFTELDAVRMVRLGAPTTVRALAYLVGVGLLTQARADVIGAFEAPQP